MPKSAFVAAIVVTFFVTPTWATSAPPLSGAYAADWDEVCQANYDAGSPGSTVAQTLIANFDSGTMMVTLRAFRSLALLSCGPAVRSHLPRKKSRKIGPTRIPKALSRSTALHSTPHTVRGKKVSSSRQYSAVSEPMDAPREFGLFGNGPTIEPETLTIKSPSGDRLNVAHRIGAANNLSQQASMPVRFRLAAGRAPGDGTAETPFQIFHESLVKVELAIFALSAVRSILRLNAAG